MPRGREKGEAESAQLTVDSGACHRVRTRRPRAADGRHVPTTKRQAAATSFPYIGSRDVGKRQMLWLYIWSPRRVIGLRNFSHSAPRKRFPALDLRSFRSSCSCWHRPGVRAAGSNRGPLPHAGFTAARRDRAAGRHGGLSRPPTRPCRAPPKERGPLRWTGRSAETVRRALRGRGVRAVYASD